MKLKKIEGIIKKSKSVAIVENGGAFWLGNERAMFPTYFEHMSLDALMTMFDLDEEKRESITEIPSELVARADTGDSCSNEELLKRVPMRIVWGKPLLPLYVSDRKEIYYIDERLLEPVRDAKEGIELYLRRDAAGKPYIAVKSGMLLIGLIEPEEADADMLQVLGCLYDLTRNVLKETFPDLQERLYE